MGTEGVQSLQPRFAPGVQLPVEGWSDVEAAHRLLAFTCGQPTQETVAATMHFVSSDAFVKIHCLHFLVFKIQHQ